MSHEIPGNRAILLLDLQNEFLAPTGRCRVQNLEFLDSIKLLLEGFRKEGGDVFWIRSEFEKQRNAGDERVILGRHDQYFVLGGDGDLESDEEDEGPEQENTRKGTIKTDAFLSLPDGQCVKKGTPGAELFYDITSLKEKGDHERVKTYYSAFEETSLIEELRGRGVRQVYICGVFTNTSIFATVASAMSHGVKVFLPPDCLGYRSNMLHNKALNAMTGEFGAETMSGGFIRKMWETGKKRAGPAGGLPGGSGDPRAMLAGLAAANRMDKAALAALVMNAKAGRESSSASTSSRIEASPAIEPAVTDDDLVSRSRPTMTRKKSRSTKRGSQPSQGQSLESSSGTGEKPTLPGTSNPQAQAQTKGKAQEEGQTTAQDRISKQSQDQSKEERGGKKEQRVKPQESGESRGGETKSQEQRGGDVVEEGREGGVGKVEKAAGDGLGGKHDLGREGGSEGSLEQQRTLGNSRKQPGNIATSADPTTNSASGSSSADVRNVAASAHQPFHSYSRSNMSSGPGPRPPSSSGRPGTANSTTSTLDSKRSSKYSVIRTIEDDAPLDVDNSLEEPSLERVRSRFELQRERDRESRKRLSLIETIDVDDAVLAAETSGEEEESFTKIPYVRAKDILAHRRDGGYQSHARIPPNTISTSEFIASRKKMSSLEGVQRQSRPSKPPGSSPAPSSTTVASSPPKSSSRPRRLAPPSPARPQQSHPPVPGSPKKNDTAYVDFESEPLEAESASESPGPTRTNMASKKIADVAVGKALRRKAYESAAPVLSEGDRLGEGDSWLLTDLLPKKAFPNVFNKVKNEVQWETMYHRGGEVPRLVAVEADVGADCSFPLYRHPSDESPPVLPFSPTVGRIRDYVQKAIGHPVNHVLIQLYRGGSDYISEHSDKTLDIVRGSNIVNVSIGAQRTMTLRTKKDSKEWEQRKLLGQDVGRGSPAGTTPGAPRPAQKIPLPHNSLFVLGPETNEKWLHAIRPDKRPVSLKKPEELMHGQERISLTFRQIGTFLAPHFPSGAIHPGSDGTFLIWGQGATSKLRGFAKPVVIGNSAEGESMLHAFGSENHMSEFDWDHWYGSGFDVLHFRPRPVPIARLAFYPSENAHVRILKQLFEARRIPVESYLHAPSDPSYAGPGITLTDLRSVPPARLETDSALTLLHYLHSTGFPIFPEPTRSSTRTYALALDLIHSTLNILDDLPMAKLPLCRGGFQEKIVKLERKVSFWEDEEEEVGLVECVIWGLVEEMGKMGVEVGDGSLRRAWTAVGEEWGAELSDLKM